MTAPRTDDPHRAKVSRNVDKMAAQGASPDEIEAYIQSEGVAPVTAPSGVAPSRGAPGFASESTGSRVGSKPTESEGPRNIGSAIVRGIEQGATFGFADELASGIDALKDAVTGGPGYDARLAENRAKLHQSRADHPVATTAAEVAGGLLPIVASGGSAAPATLGRNIAAGAGYGALAGAGNAEGDLGSRVVGAGVGSVVGGAAGGVLGSVVPAAGRQIMRAVRPDSRGLTVPVMRTATGTIAPKEIGLAERKILEALQRDNVSLDRLGNEAAGVQRTGRGTDRALVDMGGKNLIGLGRAARNVPSEGKDKLESFLFRRQKKQLPGITGAMEEGTGQKAGNIVRTVDEISDAQKAAAAPLYARAHPQIVDDPDVIATISGSPYFREAHEVGRALAHEEGITLPPLTRDVMVGDEMVTEQVPQSVQAIDYTKRGLDAVIERRMKGGSMDRDLARVLRTKLRGTLARVDEAVPEFGEARRAWAGPAQIKDAIEEGRNFLKADPRETEKTLANYSPSEQEGFRNGQLDAARQFMEKVSDTGDLAAKIMGNPAIRAKVRTMFPDNKAYVGYLREVLDRARMTRSKVGITGNSTTAQQLNEIADMAGVNVGELALEGAKAVVTGGTSLRAGFFKRAADYIEQKRSGVQGNVADAIARDLLTRPTDPAFQQLLARLTDAEKAQLRRRFIGNATASRAGGEYGGGSSSRALTP